MRDLIFTAKAAMIAGVAVALAACAGEPADNNAAANELDANMTLEGPANDASAMEAAGNASEATAPAADNADDDSAGETSGGDTGGNTLESNVSGM